MQRLHHYVRYFFLSFLTHVCTLHASSLSCEAPSYIEIDEGPGYTHKHLQLGGLAPGRISTDKEWTFSLSGSFIYWNIMQENMAIASLLQPGDPVLALTVYQEMSFHPGFKVTATSNVTPYDWSGIADYTLLHGTSTTQTAPPQGGAMVVNSGFTSPEAAYADAAFVTSNFEVALDAVDLILARPSYYGHRLIITPAAGGKLGFLDQRLRTKTKLIASPAEEVPVQYDTDTWFLGPKLGIDIEWILGYGLKSLSSFSAALLYQKQKLRADFYDISNVNDNLLDLERNFLFFHPNFQMAIGLSWGAYSSRYAFHGSLFALYEIDYYLAQNASRAATLENFYANGLNPASSGHLGDLLFHGLKAGFRCDF